MTHEDVLSVSRGEIEGLLLPVVSGENHARVARVIRSTGPVVELSLTSTDHLRHIYVRRLRRAPSDRGLQRVSHALLDFDGHQLHVGAAGDDVDVVYVFMDPTTRSLIAWDIGTDHRSTDITV